MLPTLGRTPPLLLTSPLPPRANAAEDDDELLDDELGDELDPPLPPHINGFYTLDFYWILVKSLIQ